MSKKSIAAAFLGLFLSSLAFASCPPGTRYDCYPTASGKQSCGCR